MNKQEIIKRLNNNEVGIIPTDTINGIVTKFNNKKGKKKIFDLKKRLPKKKLPILVSSFKQLKKFIILNLEIKNFLNNLKEPTTVIYDLKNSCETIAIRLVKWDWLKKIIDETGPLYATSCNISGEEFISLNFWKDKVDFIELEKKTLLNKFSKIIVFKNKKILR